MSRQDKHRQAPAQTTEHSPASAPRLENKKYPTHIYKWVENHRIEKPHYCQTR